MQVYDAIRTMLAVREYQDRPIPNEVVARIVEAARLTGSSRNRQGWDFVVVREAATLRRLGELAATGPYIADAPMAIAVVVPETPTGYMDGSRAAQDMMLTAWGEGIGSNVVTSGNTPEIKHLLGVPGDLMILALIPFGYPVAKVGKGNKKRKGPAEVAHSERYGRPFGS